MFTGALNLVFRFMKITEFLLVYLAFCISLLLYELSQERSWEDTFSAAALSFTSFPFSTPNSVTIPVRKESGVMSK